MIKLFQPYVSQNARENVIRVLSGTQIAQGPEVDLFEFEFAKTFGFEPWQIVSLNSGTAALELAYELANVDPLTDVLTPVLTCTATNIPLVRRGAKLVFVDVEGRTHMNVDPEDFKEKAVAHDATVGVFVHFGGSSEGLEAIEDTCEELGIDLICDAAQALGSKLSKKARFSCISLQAIKSLTAGDGGVLVCRDKQDAERARKLRWFGYDRALKQKLGDCDLDLAGYKMHMNDISAAIARGNLDDWQKIYSNRKLINDVYRHYAQESKHGILASGIWNPVVIDLPFTLYRDMASKKDLNSMWDGFEIGQYHFRNDKYSIFASFKCPVPNMDRLEDRYFMLPCHMGMTYKDAERIGEIIWK